MTGHAEIAMLASEYWRAAGCPSGRDEDFWLAAERALTGLEKSILAAAPGRLLMPAGIPSEITAEVIYGIDEAAGPSVPVPTGIPSEITICSPEEILGSIYEAVGPSTTTEDDMATVAKKKRVETVAGLPNCWDLVPQVVGRSQRVLLWGVSGTGKSWAARRTNLERKAQVYSVSLTDDTPAAELRGHYGLKDGSYEWFDGPCVSAWRSGGRLVLNELEKASSDSMTFLLGMLDDIEIAQQTLPTGEMIRPAAGYHVVATMNGHPDRDLDPALRDRFPVCIHIDRVAPEALAALPKDLRNIAANSGVVADVKRRLSVRGWNEFASLRKQIGDHAAAVCVFGEKAGEVLNHLKIAA